MSIFNQDSHVGKHEIGYTEPSASGSDSSNSTHRTGSGGSGNTERRSARSEGTRYTRSSKDSTRTGTDSTRTGTDSTSDAGNTRTGTGSASGSRSSRQTKPAKKISVGLIVAIVFGALILSLVVFCVVFVSSKLNKLNFNETLDTALSTGSEFTVVSDTYIVDTEGLEQREGSSALPEDDAYSDDDVFNFLLLGTDMKIPGTNDPGRCDATMVCSLNTKTGDVKLVGFERAIGVPVPGYEDEMLSYVFQYGGGEFMQETITNCFLVNLQGYVHVGYEVFPQVIDAIGGIDVELNQSEVYYMSQNLAYSESGKNLKVGANHLDGEAAYSYCRLRDPDDDWARQGRTREAVQAVVNQLKNLNVIELNNLLNEVLPMVGTNLTKTQLTSLIISSPKFLNATVTQLMIPDKEGAWIYVTGRGAAMYGCDYAACAEEINDFLYGE